jgi:hypothetical protein
MRMLLALPLLFVACARDPADSCAPRTDETVTITYTAPDGSVAKCDIGMPDVQTVSFTAAVHSVSARQVVLDACAPNAHCIPMLHTLDFDSPSLPALDTIFPPGGFAKVDFEYTGYPGCSTRLSAVSVDSWSGLANPAGTGGLLLIGASHGYTAAPMSAPFTLDKRANGCAVDGRSGCGADPDTPDGDYAFVFSAGGASLEVAMGDTTDWQPPIQPSQTWRAHDARSYKTGNCDDYWNWDWWVIRSM